MIRVRRGVAARLFLRSTGQPSNIRELSIWKALDIGIVSRLGTGSLSLLMPLSRSWMLSDTHGLGYET